MPEFRQTVRSIVHRPTFAIAAILTIALGIGANTAVYAAIHAVLLQPLPFRDPDRLVQVWETHRELHNFPVSVPDYLDLKKSVDGLQLATYTLQAMDKATLTGQGEVEKTARQLSTAYPVTNGKIGAFAVPLMETIVGDVRPALMVTWIAVALVLLIAITNLTHLMMARTVSRQQEISIRLALGASRWAVFRTSLLEAMILSLAGGVAGILAALWVLPMIRFLAHGQIPRFEGEAFNFPVLLFGTLTSFVVALLFALPSYGISFGDTRGSSVRRSRLHLRCVLPVYSYAALPRFIDGSILFRAGDRYGALVVLWLCSDSRVAGRESRSGNYSARTIGARSKCLITNQECR